MPNSLKCRLKGLVRKGLLSEKDLNRIIVVPDNAKNGEVIKTLFPYLMINECEEFREKEIITSDEWWNAPYKLSVQEIGHCKDCDRWKQGKRENNEDWYSDEGFCNNWRTITGKDFYCADFEVKENKEK